MHGVFKADIVAYIQEQIRPAEISDDEAWKAWQRWRVQHASANLTIKSPQFVAFLDELGGFQERYGAQSVDGVVVAI